MGHRGGSGWRESGFLAIKRDLSGKTREKRWFPPGYGRSGTGNGRLRTGYGRFVTGNGWLRTGHGRFVTGNGWLRTGHGRFVTGNGWLRTGNRRQRTGRCWRQFRRRWWQPSRKSADAGTVLARGGEAIAKLFPKLSLPRNAGKISKTFAGGKCWLGKREPYFVIPLAAVSGRRGK